MRSIPFLDLSGQHCEIRAGLDAIWNSTVDNSFFVGGSPVAEFEEAFASYCGVQQCVGVANGTDSLELILTACGIGPGDEVLVPANTFVATAEAVVNVGAKPVFVDADEQTLLAGAENYAKHITEKTRAIICVHLFGAMPNMDLLTDLCRSSKLILIEDAAQAHGATWNGRRAGSFGLAASFSFYPGKNLGAFGDGGAVVSNSQDLISAVRSMANHGRTGTAHEHRAKGRNSRLDALQAAVLTLKLGHLDEWNSRRAAAAALYRTLLPDFTTVTTELGSASVHHVLVVRVPSRDVVTRALDAQLIGWGLHYPNPCHRQPAFGNPELVLPVVEKAADEILSLPMFPTITQTQIELVASTINTSLSSS
jgi:dTDP-4-amino-4,6-dideoxygalactose transaminase